MRLPLAVVKQLTRSDMPARLARQQPPLNERQSLLLRHSVKFTVMESIAVKLLAQQPLPPSLIPRADSLLIVPASISFCAHL